jgi:hypothetical protein
MSDESKTTGPKTETAPETLKLTLLIVLFTLNMVFLGFVILRRLAYDSGAEIKAVESEVDQIRLTHRYEIPLFRFIVLKMEIQQDIKEGRRDVLPKIVRAIGYLEKVLDEPDIEEFIEEYKRTDLKRELERMRRLESEFASRPND